jgi:predicted ester cyclase
VRGKPLVAPAAPNKAAITAALENLELSITNPPNFQKPETRHYAARGLAKFRAAFPDLNFWGTADLIAEGDYVVGQWEGGGTHTGEAFDDMPIGSLPASTGRAMRFTGTTVLKVENGLITEEIGLDDGVTALSQLGLIPQV